jgi:ATP-binding cassette subfamily B protein
LQTSGICKKDIQKSIFVALSKGLSNQIFSSMKTNSIQTLKFYDQQVLRYRWLALTMVLTSILSSVLNVITPLYFKDLFNLIATASDKITTTDTAYDLLLIILILSLAQWVLWRIGNFSQNYFDSKSLADLSNQCFNYLHHHSSSFFNNSFVGSLVKRVNWFTRGFEVFTDQTVFNLIPLFVSVGSIVIVLFGIKPVLALAVLIWVVVFLAISYGVNRFKLKYDLARNEAEIATTALLADTITNNQNVKLFNGYSVESANFEASTNDLHQKRKLSWDIWAVFESFQTLLSVILEVGIFYLAVTLWRQGILSVGDFALIQVYALMIINQVWNFGRIIRSFYESLSDASEMTEILVTPHEIVDIHGAKELVANRGEIVFKDVIFNYNETRTVIDKMNLTIRPGEKVAFVGPSGAGKTTIIKLLFRMYDLTSGQITIDDQNIARVTQESLWQNVSLVPQDPILFHRSLMENIRYGRPEATDEEVMAAAKKARCHDFISAQEKGYETFVGERGIKLSGGERQRVAIARAILRNAPILVLDEATSSLDSESEHLIQESLEELMKGKTVLMVAHRLSTIRRADRIIVVEDGKIAEEGSHDELANTSGGIYSKLWQLQSGGFIAN